MCYEAQKNLFTIQAPDAQSISNKRRLELMRISYEPPAAMGPDEKNAFLKGYNDCKRGNQASGAISLTPAPFHSPVGFEAAYKMGWDKASEEVIAEAEKAGRRGEGWGHIKIGGIFFGAGLAITILSFMYNPDGTFLVAYGAIIFGAVNLVRGIWKYFSKETTS
jgi:hypothetical protein